MFLKFNSNKKIALASFIGLIGSLLIPLFYYGIVFLFNTSVGNLIDNISNQSPIIILASIITAAIH